jgi:hypothetical protein
LKPSDSAYTAYIAHCENRCRSNNKKQNDPYHWLKKGGEKMKNETRRQFLINSSLLLGSTMGGLAIGSRMFAPRPAMADKVTFPESSCAS